MKNSFEGQFLIAMPGMNDERFVDSLIYLVGHNDDGAMGLMVNQPMPGLDFEDILGELDLEDVPDTAARSAHARSLSVLQGGPVDTGRGFVLHTPDYFQEGNSYCVNDEVCLTATLDVLQAIAWKEEPSQSLFALGYCGWAPGQLEDEIKANGWLIAPFSRDLLFGEPVAKRYDQALSSLGISRASLSADAGHA